MSEENKIVDLMVVVRGWWAGSVDEHAVNRKRCRAYAVTVPARPTFWPQHTTPLWEINP
jgi:hypothetical protein